MAAWASRWVLLARISNAITFNGWTALRVSDIQAITIIPAEDCFKVNALKVRGTWPTVCPESVDLSDVSALLASVSHGISNAVGLP